MAQTGLHTVISFKILKNYYNKWFLYAFLIGSIIPDIDIAINSLKKIIVSYLNPNFYTSNSYYLVNYELSIFHSVITSILLYLITLMVYEIKRNEIILNFANGLLLGLLIHIIIDIFFYLRPIQIFWPLNYAGVTPLNLWENINIPLKVFTLYLAIEFLFFRYIAYELIKILITAKDKNNKYILNLSRWMKIQGLLFILFVCYFNIFKINNTTFIFYNICLSISIIYTIAILYILRYSIINYNKNKKDIIIKEKATISPTAIDNLG